MNDIRREDMQCYNCDSDAVFWVEEVWLDNGAAVEFYEPFCTDCVPGPQHHDDGAYANYRFRVEPIPEEFGMT